MRLGEGLLSAIADSLSERMQKKRNRRKEGEVGGRDEAVKQVSLGRLRAQGTCTWLTTPYLLPPLCPFYSHQIQHERLLLVLNKQKERKHFQSWHYRQLWVRRKVWLSFKQCALTYT